MQLTARDGSAPSCGGVTIMWKHSWDNLLHDRGRSITRGARVPPPSFCILAHVTRATIEGFITNQLVYRLVITIPAEGLVDCIVKSITRTHLVAFGLGSRTLRAVVYLVDQNFPVDKKLWVIVIVGLLRAFNNPYMLLHHSLWRRWPSPRLHALDTDVC